MAHRYSSERGIFVERLTDYDFIDLAHKECKLCADRVSFGELLKHYYVNHPREFDMVSMSLTLHQDER